MKRKGLTHLAAVLVAIFLIGTTEACTIVTRLRHEPVPLTGSREIGGRVKAHLLDGSTIVYPNGVTIAGGQVRGRGIRYDIRLDSTGTVGDVALDSVGAMESFRTTLDVARSLLLPAVGIAGTIGLVKVMGGPE
ncbi:hypothetical protein [Candidatus Palauibacter sp.]|uniref:hypothetical protein n=1 Tax=Candidatus Palauibacter sp. TaxID=3101350 RepID=UPI003B59C93D